MQDYLRICVRKLEFYWKREVKSNWCDWKRIFEENLKLS